MGISTLTSKGTHHASLSIPPIADDGYAALLKILADPALHKQRLEELRAQEKLARDEIAALNSMEALTRRRSSEAEAAMIVAKNRAAKLDGSVRAWALSKRYPSG
jgi:hypothetical protein